MAEAQLIQTPCVFACPDESGEYLNIEIDLPGVKKENIDFKMSESTFSIKATNDDVKYSGTFSTCCPVAPDKANANFTKEMLVVTVPFQEPHSRAVDVNIE
jgi:HSP20 family molecular chaperone IbpA